MKKISQSDIERILIQVQKPARYIGMELSSIRKEECDVRMALSYPDLYEIGMSNNGIRILYDIINSHADFACERVFAVAEDMEILLGEEGIPLFTLESHTPLCDLDILGFNVSHEMLSTNILQILDLGHIPLLARDRSAAHPLVIAGGEGVSNPLPLFDFIDVFFLGDGEEGIVDILESVSNGKKAENNREEMLETLSGIDGILIPSLTGAGHGGGVTGLSSKTVRRRVYSGAELKDPIHPIVPNMRISQERVVVEVARGCGNLCRYCHAGYYDLPCRSYDSADIAGRVLDIVNNTGYNEVTLSSLSISDYPQLINLLNQVLPRLTEKGVSISLPSLRVDVRTLSVLEQISGVRKPSLTFAVESASDEIRERANKHVVIDELIEIIDHVFEREWKTVKLYFMVGLPGCEDHDEAESIISLLKRIYHGRRGRRDINVTISPFVPKPHTPFQWEEQKDAAYFMDVVKRIKSGVPRAVKIRSHNINASILEGIFSRGDSRLGEIILKAYKDGCRFDSWEEHFKFYIWQRHLDEQYPEWKTWLNARSKEEMLPWDVITTGYENVIEKMESRDSLSGKKNGPREFSDRLDVESVERARVKFTQTYDVKKKIRLRLTKTGLMRFIPHLDFVEIVKRGLRMIDAPVSMTQGFNKRERISAGLPLPLGIESRAELLDIDLHGDVADGFLDRLSQRLPEGIDATAMQDIDDKASLMSMMDVVEYAIATDDEIFKKINGTFTEQSSFVKKTKKNTKDVPFEEVLWDFDFADKNNMIIKLRAGTGSSMRIDQVVQQSAGIDLAEIHRVKIVKTEQYRLIGDDLVVI